MNQLNQIAKEGANMMITLRRTRGVISNLFVGAGIAYAISKEKYSHVPIPIFFPSAYVGYQLYKNRSTVYENTINAVGEIKNSLQIEEKKESRRRHS